MQTDTDYRFYVGRSQPTGDEDIPFGDGIPYGHCQTTHACAALIRVLQAEFSPDYIYVMVGDGSYTFYWSKAEDPANNTWLMDCDDVCEGVEEAHTVLALLQALN